VHALKNIPENYHSHKTLSLSNPRSVLWLNLAAILLLVFYGWLFTYLIDIFRPLNQIRGGLLGLFSSISILELLFCILSIIFMLALHELIHGIFFWLFTRELPKFALKPGYAFAAAPDWYLPKLQYIMVGLSPFIIISTSCIILALFAPSNLIPYLLIIATFNAAGSLGDLIVVGWVINQPSTILIKDEGDVFSSYSTDFE
jgi:hypothetical protein